MQIFVKSEPFCFATSKQIFFSDRKSSKKRGSKGADPFHKSQLALHAHKRTHRRSRNHGWSRAAFYYFKSLAFFFLLFIPPPKYAILLIILPFFFQNNKCNAQFPPKIIIFLFQFQTHTRSQSELSRRIPSKCLSLLFFSLSLFLTSRPKSRKKRGKRKKGGKNDTKRKIESPKVYIIIEIDGCVGSCPLSSAASETFFFFCTGDCCARTHWEEEPKRPF